MLEPDHLKELHLANPILSEVFSRHWDTPLKTYAATLYQKPPTSLEPELVSSFQEEWCDMGCPAPTIAKAVRQLEQNPVLQTAHHITPTNGPTFLTLDLISLSGLKADQIYLVGANSGVAFSNSAWTGALSFGRLALSDLLRTNTGAFRQANKSSIERNNQGEPNQRITIIPSRQRDQLVFGYRLTPFQAKIAGQFTDQLKELTGEIIEGELYSHWSAKTCTAVQKKTFGRENILIFDINRVVQRYLIKIFSKATDHPVKRLFFSSPENIDILSMFNQPFMFLGSRQGKKSFKVNSLFWENNGLESDKTGSQKYDRQGLIEGLEKELLCPGIFISFFILRFLNGIRCLGSFFQIEYLEEYRRNWEKLNLNWGLDLQPDYLQSLTTGRLYKQGHPLWPLDMAIKQQILIIEDYALWKMGELWTPVVNQLLKEKPK